MQRLAAKGDAEAQRWFQVDLWKDYDPPLACFLCDADIHKVDVTLCLPDKKPRKGQPQQMMITPMCEACDALPAMVRWNRTLKILKAMHGGRQFNFKLKG
jgi:hypothetical protein